MICAYAIGAAQIFIFVRGEFPLAIERLQAALNEAYAYGAVGRDIFGSDFSIDIVVHPGAGAYICGEETALLESLEGKRGYPRIKPPFFPAALGLYGAPTIVNNVETLSNLPWLVRNGGDAFAALGEGRSKGTKLIALAGHVKRPGNYELEWAKVSFRDLIYDPRLGGGIRDDNELKVFIPGGASSPWLGPEHLDVLLANEAIAAVGSMAGSGSVIPMDHTTCTVRAAWRIVRFFHRESCGQCTPCREGGGWLEKILERIENGQGRESDLDLLMDVCDNISPGVTLAPGPDHHLRARPVHAACGGRRAADVPRRVPGPHPRGPLPVPARSSASEDGPCLSRPVRVPQARATPVAGPSPRASRLGTGTARAPSAADRERGWHRPRHRPRRRRPHHPHHRRPRDPARRRASGSSRPPRKRGCTSPASVTTPA